MISKATLFESMLRENGYSVTASRQAVFAALNCGKPMGMQAVVEQCHHIDRASVYRSVALFEEIGIVRRLYTGWKYKLELTDRFGSHHHHATCSACGQSISLEEDSKLEDSLRELAARHAFTIRGHEIELTGLCEHCATSVN